MAEPIPPFTRIDDGRVVRFTFGPKRWIDVRIADGGLDVVGFTGRSGAITVAPIASNRATVRISEPPPA